MEDEHIDEVRRLTWNSALELKENGHPVDLENFEENFSQAYEKAFNSPNEEFNGFTSKEMHSMCHYQLEEGCPVQLLHLTPQEIVQIPFMRQSLHLMKTLEQKDIRLNANGTLPIKIVSELYQMREPSVNQLGFQQRTEENIVEVQVLRMVLKETGLTTIKKGKLSLTAKGKSALLDPNSLMRTIIRYFFTEYNTGWVDQKGHYMIGNEGRLYSLWMLHHFGEQFRPMEFYNEEYFKAFPHLNIQESQMKIAHYYQYRVFRNLFAIIGLCEFNEGQQYGGANYGKDVHKTPILDMMFSFEEPAQI